MHICIHICIVICTIYVSTYECVCVLCKFICSLTFTKAPSHYETFQNDDYLLKLVLVNHDLHDSFQNLILHPMANPKAFIWRRVLEGGGQSYGANFPRPFRNTSCYQLTIADWLKCSLNFIWSE